mmetsp:Transcript_22905/g.58297  ORF Transcript_22905/g.58297 Transcript_22905/m.58297 type:complete len:229 (-) Transcript_22905:2-688(-)
MAGISSTPRFHSAKGRSQKPSPLTSRWRPGTCRLGSGCAVARHVSAACVFRWRCAEPLGDETPHRYEMRARLGPRRMPTRMSKAGSFRPLRNTGSDRSRRIREAGFQALLADGLRFGLKLPSCSASHSSWSESSASAAAAASAFTTQLSLKSRTGDGWPETGSMKTMSSLDTRRSLSEGGGRSSSGRAPAVDAVPYGEAAVGPWLGGPLTASSFFTIPPDERARLTLG